MTGPQQDTDWLEWKNLVLDKLDSFDSMRGELLEIKLNIKELQMKAGVWGFVAGAIPTIGMLLFLIIKKAL